MSDLIECLESIKARYVNASCSKEAQYSGDIVDEAIAGVQVMAEAIMSLKAERDDWREQAQRNDTSVKSASEINPSIAVRCECCDGRGMIGGMTQEGGEGFDCEDCDGTGVFINPQYKAEIGRDAIMDAIRACETTMVDHNHGDRMSSSQDLSEYANNLTANSGET